MEFEDEEIINPRATLINSFKNFLLFAVDLLSAVTVSKC